MPKRLITTSSESSSTTISGADVKTTGASLPPITLTISSTTSLDEIPSLILAEIDNCPEKLSAGVTV